MKLRSILIAATILALSPAAPILAQAQTPPSAPPAVSAPGGDRDARMHEAWQRFEQEQAERKQKFEQEQAERAQRFEEMQAKHKAEFEQRMQEWAQKREERQAQRPNMQAKPNGGTPVAPAAPAPVAPATGTVQ